MTIRGTPKRAGVSRAEAVCDDCGREETITADYTRRAGGNWEVNVGQATRKIVGQGWAEVKGKHYCPTCEAKRKSFKMREPKVANVSNIREPDGKQKRLIIMALEDAYDDVKKCYKGQETDKTVAETLGAGVMPGWVSKIREEMFGPAGNEEVMEILGQISALAANFDKVHQEYKMELGNLRKRVDVSVLAHDKRVG